MSGDDRHDDGDDDQGEEDQRDDDGERFFLSLFTLATTHRRSPRHVVAGEIGCAG